MAMKMLKAKLYELEVNKRNAAAGAGGCQSDVSWAPDPSYVLDQSRIKDLRTASKSAIPQVLDAIWINHGSESEAGL